MCPPFGLPPSFCSQAGVRQIVEGDKRRQVFCILLCKVNPDLREKTGQASQKPSNVYMGRRTAAFSGHIKLFVTLCLKKLLLSETQHTPVLVG